MDPALMTVWTIGHSTRTAGEFVALLQIHRVEQLADIRTIPRSRRNPQFHRDELDASLAAAEIGYLHVAGLGGLRRPQANSTNDAWRNDSFRGYADYMQTAEFERSLAELLEMARLRRVVVMCAEAVPWRCHRSLVADALTVRAVEVLHILSDGPAKAHVVTAFARVDGTDVTYPGLPREGCLHVSGFRGSAGATAP